MPSKTMNNDGGGWDENEPPKGNRFKEWSGDDNKYAVPEDPPEDAIPGILSDTSIYIPKNLNKDQFDRLSGDPVYKQYLDIKNLYKPKPEDLN